MISNNRFLLVSSVVVILAHKRLFAATFLLTLCLTLGLLFSVTPRYSIRMSMQQLVDANSSLYQAAYDQAYFSIVRRSSTQNRDIFKFAVAAALDDSIWWAHFQRHPFSKSLCGPQVGYGCFEQKLISSLGRNFSSVFPQQIDIELISGQAEQARDYLADVLNGIEQSALELAMRELEQLRVSAELGGIEFDLEGRVLNVTVSPFVAADPVYPKYAFGVAASIVLSLFVGCCLVWFTDGWRKYPYHARQ